MALLLFALQLVMGLYIAFNYFYTVPQSVVDGRGAHPLDAVAPRGSP